MLLEGLMSTETTSSVKSRLVIISNRLPIVLSHQEGKLNVASGSGGLVTALAPVLKNRGGVWLGWTGPVEEGKEDEVSEIIKKHSKTSGFTLCPVFLTPQEIKNYYDGFSNEIIWPLFHDLQSECNFNPAYWYAAQEVNEKFALSALKIVRPNDFIWVHDYHLLLLGQYIRKIKPDAKMGFFLHIPFPSLEIFITLPWRFQILRGLLEYDTIGFQTLSDQRHFVDCIKRLLPDVLIKTKKNVHECAYNGRVVRIGTFPISIDYNEFANMASSRAVADEAWINHEKFANQKIVFSLDRLDITKGIPYRLEAIRYLLKKHPEVHERVTFIQNVIPSRVEIPKYQALKKEIDRLVGEINSQFTKPGWVPIHYVFHSIPRKELLSLYRSSEICLITSLKDGMNLVAKEFIASNADGKGALVVSEFAGVAAQVKDEAFLINPYDIEGIAQALYDAITSPEDDLRRRMHKMRRGVQKNDVYRWVRRFLTTAINKELVDFPLLPEYLPEEKKEGA